MSSLLQIFLVISIPALFILLCKKVKVFSILSPIVWCYVTGILLTNFQLVSFNASLNESISQITILLAIPLLLITTNTSALKSKVNKGLLSFGLAILSVSIVSFCSGFIFRSTSNIEMVLAMLTGVLSGGTPNMASISIALNTPEYLFVSLTTADIITGGSYLFFMSSIGVVVYRKFFPTYEYANDNIDIGKGKLNFRQKAIGVLQSLIIAILIAFISVGIVFLFLGELNFTLIILLLTTFSFSSSFFEQIRNTSLSFETGDYLLLVFSLVVGTLANVETAMNAGLEITFIAFFVIILSMLLHLILAKFFKIDADTLMITSTAAVLGPPFIGPIASAMKNKEIVALGMSCGLLGLAIGNYVGLAVYFLLCFLLNS